MRCKFLAAGAVRLQLLIKCQEQVSLFEWFHRQLFLYNRVIGLLA